MSELSVKLKSKYPQYQNIPDDELESKILAKYPQYGNLTKSKEPIDNTSNVENLIHNRPSEIDVNNPINPVNLTPLGGSKMIPESLRALSGGMEVAEGVPADIGLGLQRARETGGKSIIQIPSDIWKTLKGERPAQFGDIYRGAGAPESVASTGGFLTAMSPITPTGAFGELAAKGVMDYIKPSVKPIGNAIKSGTAEVMSHMSGVPKQNVMTALDNPKVISGRYVKNQVEKAGQAMEKNVKPLVNDPNAMVTATPQITGLSQKLNLYTPSGESTRILSSMSEPEKKMIGDWLQRADNGKGEINFNEADKIVGEIDSELQAYYKAKKMGQIYKNTQFDRVAKEIRDAVNEARKSQFPEAGKAIDSYSEAMRGQDANRSFSRIAPRGSFANMATRGALELALGIANPAAAVGLGAAQSPFLQGKAIQAGAMLGGTLSNPSLMAQTFRKLNENRRIK